MKKLFLMHYCMALLTALCGALTGGESAQSPAPELIRKLIPVSITVNKSNLPDLTSDLRKKIKTLGLNNRKGPHGKRISTALALLPKDRAKIGVIVFEIENGANAGIHQCEVLGRGKTSLAPKPGWLKSLIDGTTIYYAPMDTENGAAVPGVYDARIISPKEYEIELADKPDDLKGEADLRARIANPDGKPKLYFSAVFKHWYSKTNRAEPIDLFWADYPADRKEAGGYPVFERRPAVQTPIAKAGQTKRLSSNPRYYYGPYGRSGFAVHTDRWDDPGRRNDPAYTGRPELADFRYRDTFGCIKVRPDCLLLLNEFMSGQINKRRIVRYDVRETVLLDSIPNKIE